MPFRNTMLRGIKRTSIFVLVCMWVWILYHFVQHPYEWHAKRLAQESDFLQAMKNAEGRTKKMNILDLSSWVNPLIGTENNGHVCPGASVPFGMAKITTDFEGWAPAGYLGPDHPVEILAGLSPLHDSGIGAGGSYGNFGIMPIRCPHGFGSCITKRDDRKRNRVHGSEGASPGYFTLTLDAPVVKVEATSTRRAGLERFTFQPDGEQRAYFVLDLSHNLGQFFSGGEMDIDPKKGRIRLGGRWRTSFGPEGPDTYQVFACYDVIRGHGQTLDEYGIWTTNSTGHAVIQQNGKQIKFPHKNSPYVNESGALFSYRPGLNTITLRLGVSFVSANQACSNAEEEIGNKSFEEVQAESVQQWNEKLGRLEIPLNETEEDIAVMIYSSMYRSFLTPNNASGETQGAFAGTSSPYFDSLYCSWDTSRTYFPWMHLHSPKEMSEIIESYIDGWRKTGLAWFYYRVIPECRSNNLPSWSQGGSDGTNILADFALKYQKQAKELGINLDEMYTALITDAEKTPADWRIGGRQIDLYKKYGYIPYMPSEQVGDYDYGATREVSRTLEYAFNDFGIRQVAGLLGHSQDTVKYEDRSLWYRNLWDPNVTSDGYQGFFQRRFPNGTFVYSDPKTSSRGDPEEERRCFFFGKNDTGFYESSGWEYSFYAPHDTAHLIKLHGGKEIFIQRLDHFFESAYDCVGNEPGFQTPVMYHYAGKPANSIETVRSAVRQYFYNNEYGIPGNDDQAAMATLLLFHLLGIYPVPSTNQYLILSPWVPYYTLHNPYLNVSTTVRVTGFDKGSLTYPIPPGSSAYVKEVKFNGNKTLSRCFIDFHKVFAVGGDLEIILTEDRDSTDGCDGPLPDSISTGGFPVHRSTSA